MGGDAFVGEVATVARSCRPLGYVRVRGELWRALCEEGADAGDQVRVVGADGLTLRVERG